MFFSGSQVPYPNQTSLTVSVNVPTGIAAQNYPFKVKVASGPSPVSVPFTLAVEDFSLQPPAAGRAWAPPGATVTLNLNAQSVNSFSSTINVSCTMNSGSCTGGSFWVGPNGTPVNLTLSEPSNAALGADTLTVTGSYGSVSHTLSFPFYVADYAGTLSASALTIAQGHSGSISATVTATQGFSDTVSFSCTGTAQLSCQFSPSAVQPTASSPQTSTITITANGSASLFPSRHGDMLLLVASILPVGLLFAVTRKQKPRPISSALTSLLLMIALALCSCGGGKSSSVGGGGSYNATVTVNAAAAGTNITRTLGTINVTVTY